MTKRSLRAVQYAENDSDDDDSFISLKRRKKSKLAKNSDGFKKHNGNNSDDEFLPRNGSSEQHSKKKFRRSRHSQIKVNMKNRKKLRRRSFCSLRYDEDEDGTSCDDDIGALATSQHSDSFPNMLLRRSSRTKKTRFETLNLSRIEHDAMMNEAPESPQPISRRLKSKSIKPELRDLLIAQGKSPDEAESLQPPDIYSSIKSRQRQPKKFFNDDFRDPTEPILPGVDEVTEQNQCNDELQEDVENTSLPEIKEENEKEENETLETNHVIERDKDGEKEQKETDESEQEEEEEEESEEESEESESDEYHRVARRRYSLRKRRVKPSRLVDELKRQTRRRSSDVFDRVSGSLSRHKRPKKIFQQNMTNPYQQRERRTYSQEASSTSPSSANEADDDETKFAKRKEKSMTKARNRCLPMNLTVNELNSHGFSNERRKIGSSLADVDPMKIDRTVKFDSIGGHKKHIRSLKEMVVFPLTYPEVFQKFSINPPRGCLFHGPPGTGKTLMARALANECSTEGRKVAFFMRKGADCLSKWVGESERQLRLLFDQAYQMRPAIIFFDEIDGLAPVRSSRQDQIHSSIVSTLLGLMDGLDSRGEIIVIGATNRIDSIDPALRRPGRFDREFAFPLPDKKARHQILSIHTRKWIPPLSEEFLEELAERTCGYCGADIMALCAESTLYALRRRYPQIYSSNDKLKLNVDSINVTASDFSKAMKRIVPTAQRSAASPARNLPLFLRPLLGSTLHYAIKQLAKLFPLIKKKSKFLRSSLEERVESHVTATSESESDSEEEHRNSRVNLPPNGMPVPSLLASDFNFPASKTHRPRILFCGNKGSGLTSHVAPALLYDLEGFPVHVLDIPVLYGNSTRTPEEACAQIFREAQRTAPSIVYMPNAPTWWESTSPTVQQTFHSILTSVSSSTPVLLVATANCAYKSLCRKLREVFRPSNTRIIDTIPSTFDERIAFFSPLYLHLATRKPVNKLRKKPPPEVLEKVTAPEATKLSEKELEKIEYQEEATMTNLRLFLRDVLTRLARDRRFKVFLKPVDIEEVPDYAEVVAQPMDLSTMMGKIDRHLYSNVQSFICDINLICTNALEYNPEHNAEDRAIRHRACLLRDMAHAIIQNELEPSFEKLCNDVIDARKKRNADPLKFAPAKFSTPSNRRNPQVQSSNSQLRKKKQPLSSSSSPYFDLHPKRKKSAWASGIIKKYTRKKTQICDETEEEKMTSSDENIDVEVDNSPHDEKNKVAINEVEHLQEDSQTQELEEEDPSQVVEHSEAENKEEFEEEDAPSDVKQEEDTVESMEEESGGEQGVDQKSRQQSNSEVESTASSSSEKFLVSTFEEDPEKNTEKNSNSENKSSDSNSEDEEEVKQEVESSNSPESFESEEREESMKVNENFPDADQAKNDVEDEDEITCAIKPCSSPAACSNMQDTLPPSPELIVDKPKLKELLFFTVQNTMSLCVEDLENLYSVLVRCIYRHQHSYNKSKLLKELSEEVEEFLKFIGDEPTNERTSDTSEF